MPEEQTQAPQQSKNNHFRWQEVAGAFLAIIIIVILVSFFGNNPKAPEDQGANIQQAVSQQQQQPVQQGEVPNINVPIYQDDHILGSITAPVTLVVFVDFQCPFSAKFYQTLKTTLANNRGDLRIIFRHYPLSFHQSARVMAAASECAAAQGKYWGYVDQMLTSADLSRVDLRQCAKATQLDLEQFDTCLQANEYAQKIKRDVTEANQIGVQGTPSSVLISARKNTQFISGTLDLEELQPMINAALRN